MHMALMNTQYEVRLYSYFITRELWGRGSSCVTIQRTLAVQTIQPNDTREVASRQDRSGIGKAGPSQASALLLDRGAAPDAATAT